MTERNRGISVKLITVARGCSCHLQLWESVAAATGASAVLGCLTGCSVYVVPTSSWWPLLLGCFRVCVWSQGQGASFYARIQVLNVSVRDSGYHQCSRSRPWVLIWSQGLPGARLCGGASRCWREWGGGGEGFVRSSLLPTSMHAYRCTHTTHASFAPAVLQAQTQVHTTGHVTGTCMYVAQGHH